MAETNKKKTTAKKTEKEPTVKASSVSSAAKKKSTVKGTTTQTKAIKKTTAKASSVTEKATVKTSAKKTNLKTTVKETSTAAEVMEKSTEKKNIVKTIVTTTPAQTPVQPVSFIKPSTKENYSPIPTASQTQANKKKKAKQRFSEADLLAFKKELLALRDKIQGRSGDMKNAALKGVDDVNPEEDGTDAFMRLQTLDQVKNQHKDLVHINEALRAIENGTYGVCSSCGELIRKQRLEVLPFAKNCIKCQSKLEQQNHHR